MDYLPAIILEQHVLATLRVLGLYHVTSLAERSDFLPQIGALTRNLRALGSALDGRHGQPWGQMLQKAQVRLSLALEDQQGSTTASFLFEQALASILALRHGPADVRLAQPGLGLDLVTLAVATEHLLVLGVDPHAPEPPTFTVSLLSPREEALLEVTRQLAALAYQGALPRGHQATAGNLRATAQQVRRAARAPGEDQGPGAGLVVRNWTFVSGDNFERQLSLRESPRVRAVVTSLLRSLVTANDSPLCPKHDTALALSLDAVADILMPFDAAGV